MRQYASVFVLLLARCLLAQDTPKLDQATQQKLRQAVVNLSAAQKAEDEVAVKNVVKQSTLLLGDQAGLPEVADEFRPIPQDVKPLSPQELTRAFDPYRDLIERRKWWTIGLDPTRTSHALREVASVIEGCLSARSAGASQPEKLLRIARDAGDFLIWAQEQAGTGIFPFPAVRNGTSRPFEVAERFYRQAEKQGKLAQVIVNGWAVEDFDDGGLQFDNGLAGVALVQLFEATKDDKYRKSAVRAAEWAMKRRVVTNWNYNSFSVYLLAEVYRITNDRMYLDAARKKARLGVLPGQLQEGPRQGRWADAHNARPAYHYIMVRALAALAAGLPHDDPDLPAIVKSLQLALQARNPDFQKGIVSVDSAVEALVRVKSLPPRIIKKLADCQSDEALTALESYAVEDFRSGKSRISPGAWGLMLAHVKTKR